MLRKSRILADEFAQAAKKESFPKAISAHSKYGSPPLLKGRSRTTWIQAVVIETTEQNRLLNYKKRWGWLIDEIDAEALSEQFEGLKMNDLRVDDTRRTPFKCRHCSHRYVQSIKQRLYYDKHCPRCYVPRSFCGLEEHGEVVATKTTLVKQCAEVEGDEAKQRLLSLMRTSSPVVLNWNCVECGTKYACSVRARAAAANATSKLSELYSRCHNCRWTFHMKREAQQYEM